MTHLFQSAYDYGTGWAGYDSQVQPLEHVDQQKWLKRRKTSAEMTGPMFPSLLPKVADPLWFNVDKPCDDESELTKLEEEHAAWVKRLDLETDSFTRFPLVLYENCRP